MWRRTPRGVDDQATARDTFTIGRLGATVKIPSAVSESAYAVVEHPLASGTRGALKWHHRVTWAAGDDNPIAQGLRAVIDHLVPSAGVRAGERVLDIVCGAGSVALRAHTRTAVRILLVLASLVALMATTGTSRGSAQSVTVDGPAAPAQGEKIIYVDWNITASGNSTTFIGTTKTAVRHHIVIRGSTIIRQAPGR